MAVNAVNMPLQKDMLKSFQKVAALWSSSPI
jgi:hypothetical protein